MGRVRSHVGHVGHLIVRRLNQERLDKKKNLKSQCPSTRTLQSSLCTAF